MCCTDITGMQWTTTKELDELLRISSIVVVSNDCKDYGDSYLIECELCPWDKRDSDELNMNTNDAHMNTNDAQIVQSRPLNMLAIRMTNDSKNEAL